MRVPRGSLRSGRPGVKHAYRIPRSPIGVQIGNVIGMHKWRAVRSHFAKAPVVGSQTTCDSVLLQDSRDSSTQRVTCEVFYRPVGSLQRGNGLLIPLRVPDEVERNKRVVEHISYRMGSRYVQGVSVMDYGLLVGVSCFESPIVWDRVVAVITDYRVFSAIDCPTSLWLLLPLLERGRLSFSKQGFRGLRSFWLGFPQLACQSALQRSLAACGRARR